MHQVVQGFCCFALMVISCLSGLSQTIWNGPKLVFEKADYANWLLEENQDRITDSVWITRQDNQGIFNIRVENNYDRQNRTSPLGTEWANGQIADGIENLTFTTWQNSKQNSSADEVGKNKVLHLIAEDIYIDIKFLSWTPGGGGSGTGFGGGFSYERSTPLASGVEQNLGKQELYIVQRSGQLEVKSPEKIKQVTVYTYSGGVVFSDALPATRTEYTLPIEAFSTGVYVLVVNEQYRIKFVKY